MAVQVPKVRADKAVTGDDSLSVLLGIPAGSDLEEEGAGVSAGPE